jgi:hypothetical protein
MLRKPIFDRPPYSLTNKGLRISAIPLGENEEENGTAIIPLNCTMDGRSYVAMRVAKTFSGKVVRSGCVVIDDEVNVEETSHSLLQVLHSN